VNPDTPVLFSPTQAANNCSLALAGMCKELQTVCRLGRERLQIHTISVIDSHTNPNSSIADLNGPILANAVLR
jgi:hypothetical protein